MNSNADQIYTNNLVNQYQAHLAENTVSIHILIMIQMIHIIT